MKIIVGLGNPGDKYKGTRHNAGFYFVDQLAANPEIAPAGESLRFNYEKKFEAEITKSMNDGEEIILVKPQTFMNLSGQAVQKIISFYKADISDLIVISDDIDIPLGYARIRHEGSSGGQKGLQNIIDLLGTDKLTRIRIGVAVYAGNVSEHDQLPRFDAVDFVLSKFTDRETELLDKIVGESIDYILPFIGKKDEQIPAHTIQVI